MEFDNVRIAGLACAVPSFVQEIDENPTRADAEYTKYFIKNVGVRQRHISVTGQTSTDLCFAASKRAMEKAGWRADSVDAVISITQTNDYIRPGNAHLLHYLLGLPVTAMTLDLVIGCPAFPYGLSVACSLLQSPNINRVIVGASDTVCSCYKSKETMLADNSFIFGEGGAVILLEKQRQSPQIKFGLWADGSGYKHLYAPMGVRNPWVGGWDGAYVFNGETVHRDDVLHSVYRGSMDGVEIMSFATIAVVDSIKEFLERYHEDIENYEGFVLHQANLQIMKAMVKRLKADMRKVPLSIDRYANTSAASVALTIADAYAGSEKESLRLLASGFGIGLAWGIADIHIKPSVIAPVFTYDGVFEEGICRRVE